MSLPYSEQEWTDHLTLLNPFLNLQMNIVREELIFPKDLYALYLTYLKDQGSTSLAPMLYATFEYVIEERELPFIKKTPFPAYRDAEWLHKLKYLSYFLHVQKPLLETPPINTPDLYQLYLTYLSENNVPSLAFEVPLFSSAARSIAKIYL